MILLFRKPCNDINVFSLMYIISLRPDSPLTDGLWAKTVNTDYNMSSKITIFNDEAPKNKNQDKVQ